MNVIKSILEKNYPLEDYASCLGYRVVRTGSLTYSLKEHDSLTIFADTNTFYRYSTGEHGDIINLHCTLTNDNLKEAINSLKDFLKIDDNKKVVQKDIVKPKIEETETEDRYELLEKQKEELKRSESVTQIYKYLLKRKIDTKVIDDFVKKDLLYQSKNGECVFTSYKDGKLNFMQTDNRNGFKRSFRGNDYNTCYYIDNNSRATIVTESIIDTMSVMTLLDKRNKRMDKYNYISLCGCSNIKSVYNHCLNKDIDYLILGLDNDKAGNLAKDKIINNLKNSSITKKLTISTFIPKNSKDWNEELQLISKQPSILEQYIKNDKNENIKQERKERMI